MIIRSILSTSRKGYAIRIVGVIGVLLVLTTIVLIPTKRSLHAIGYTPTDNSGDWTTYMWDNGRSGFNSTETIINPGTASHLKLHWMDHAGGAINTQPIVVNGVIYWGSWDGYEHAMDLQGNILWQTYLGVTSVNHCEPPSAGVASTATDATIQINGTPTEVIFVGGGDAHFYALAASDGHIIWSILLGSSPSHMIWDAPAVYNGSVYIGLSSYGDCPLVRGQLFQLDETTGTILHIFTTGPGKCSGGGIWGSPTIDEGNNAIYFSTGNGTCQTAFSLIELSTIDLSLISSWQLPSSQRLGDADFGSTPTLFEATINGVAHHMVGLVNKFGIYFAFDRSNIGAGPVWQQQVSSGKGNISSSGWDGSTLYVSSVVTTIHGQSCRGSVRALDPATGEYRWEYCAPGRIVDSVTLVPGVVIVGAGAHLVVLDAQSGQQLFSYRDNTGGAVFYGAASVSNGVLYIGNAAGNLYAFES